MAGMVIDNSDVATNQVTATSRRFAAHIYSGGDRKKMPDISTSGGFVR